MMDKTCPKCDRQMNKPYWHPDDSECKKSHSHSSRKEEHLHYYCSCGYDICTDVMDRGR